jgi:two-component system chemotaxis sensor kinase CheA
MSLDQFRATFFEESAELLDSAYAQLGALAEARADDETLHALFRAIHSIKGGAGAFGFSRLVALSHVMETLLDRLREGSLAATPARVTLLLQATDALADLLAADRGGRPAPDGIEDQLVAALAEAVEAEAPAPTLPRPAPVDALPAADTWRIRFRPHPRLFAHANEPLLLVRELQRLGQLAIEADLSALPPLDRLEPEDACIGWTFTLHGATTRQRIEEVFEFVVDDCDLEVAPLDRAEEPEAPVTPTTADAAPLAETSAAPARAEATPAAAPSVRVDVAKVDRLVNLVGELVINQAMLVQLGAALPPDACPGLATGLETLSQHLRELQEGVMAIRTQPVKSVFSRMPRLVRELSSQLGKDVRLVVTGEATEVDKTVIEQLADPLTHLLRNALDHGIETPSERIAAGKPAQGTVHLSAEQRSGRILIEISDDGRGIDRARVLARARERGLVAPEATPSEAEIDELIFLPSFSTAATVSAVSGRGVGMDVVRRNIQALGGRISVDSRFGEGSRFVLSLPLTLAVMDGLVVSVGREAYILPIASIVESLRPRPQDIHAVVGRGQVLAIRGAYVPLLPLHHRFAVTGAEPDPARGIVVIVETDNAGRLGLLVDDLVGQQQVVVKSLEANYGAVPGIGGATILGNGRVALILDVPGLAAGAVLH